MRGGHGQLSVVKFHIAREPRPLGFHVFKILKIS
jgi:hypothetical protein